MEKETKWISGFWHRIGALLIDSLVLGLVGLILGFIFDESFAKMGVWGRSIGFIIALLYFGIMNSSINNGQTLGKMVLKIRVVDSKNQPINIIQSFGRYCVLGIPFFLNGAQFSSNMLDSFWIYITSFIALGGLFSIIYLYIFNRSTRQSLHDLALGTFVVNTRSKNLQIAKVWKYHFVTTGLIFLIAGIAPVFITKLADTPFFDDLLKIQESLQVNPIVRYAGVTAGKQTSTINSETTNTTFLTSRVYLNKDEILNAELARVFAQSMVDSSGQLPEKDVIQVNLIYGFDIGIYSQWSTHLYEYKPDDFISEDKRGFYITRDEIQYGPYDRATIDSMLKEGRVLSNDWAWSDGEKDWLPLGQLLSKHK